MLFGRRKPGFGEGEEPAMNEEVEEKQDLLEYLASLEDVPEDLIPPKIKEAMEQDRIDDEAKANAPIVELTPGEMLAEFIRKRSVAAELTSYTSLKEEDPEIDLLLEEIKGHTELSDIMQIKGNKDTYYYSSEGMTDNYAMIAALVVEKDYARTVAEMVRFNCKTYPAPTPSEYFTRHPYYYTDAQLERVRKELERDELYTDIGEVITGNNKVYFHSTQSMTRVYAVALAEDTEQGEYGYR